MRRTFEIALDVYGGDTYEVAAEIRVCDGEIRSISAVRVAHEGTSWSPAPSALAEIVWAIPDKLGPFDLREIEGLDRQHADEEAAEHESERERGC